MTQITVYTNKDLSNVQVSLDNWRIDEVNRLLHVWTKRGNWYIFPLDSVNYFVIEGENSD